MASNKSTLCNPSSASDVGGVSNCTNLELCYNTIVDNYPPCAPGVDCPELSPCPQLTNTYSTGDTQINGTGSIGATVEVYVNGINQGNTIVNINGNWFTTIPALSNGDTLSVSQTVPNKSTSSIWCEYQIIKSCNGTPLPAPIITNSSGKNICGTGIPGSDIEVYFPDGTLYPANPNATVSSFLPVTSIGEWVWKCTGNTGGCNAGSGVDCINEGGYVIYQIDSLTGCPSLPAFECVTQGGGYSPVTSPTPVINPTTVFAGSNSVDVSVMLNGAPSPQSGYIYLLINGQINAVSSLISSSGTYSITVDPLFSCDTITSRFIQSTASGDHDCFSPSSDSIVISSTTVEPTILGEYCTSTTISSISGICSEPAGTLIKLYINGSNTNSTNLQSDGTWSFSGLALNPSDVIYATSTLANCGNESANSNSITIGSLSTNSSSITTSSITEGDSIISGTGTTNDTVFLYVDDVYSDYYTVVVSGNWTISNLPSYVFYSGAQVYVKAKTPGYCEGNPSNNLTVQCQIPNNQLSVLPKSITLSEVNIVDSISISNSQNGV